MNKVSIGQIRGSGAIFGMYTCVWRFYASEFSVVKIQTSYFTTGSDHVLRYDWSNINSRSSQIVADFLEVL